MATEVDTPEQISRKMKEAEDIVLLQPLNVAFNQHHSEETKEPESRHNQPLETSNYVGETTFMVEEKDIELDNETAVDVEADEGKNIFLSPSVPKFTTEENSSEKKDYKASDIPNLAEGEMSKNETLVEEIDHAEIRPSEEVREDKNERADVLKSTEDVCISTEIEPSYNQNEEKVIEKGQGTEVSTPLINELIEDTTAEKTAPDKGGEKIDETFGKKDLVSTEDKTQFKPETCQDEMESETTVKMSKKEAGTKDESTEKIVMADSNINTRISDDENPDSTEATTRDYEDGEELTAVMDEHKNEAEEHSKTETSKQEEHSEQRYRPENEPRKQDPERFLDVASEEIQKTTNTDHDQTITYSEEQSLPASLEGNLEEEKTERTIHADEIEDGNIPEEKVLETNEGQDKLEPILNKTADSDSSTKSLEKSVQEISQEVEEREEHESAGVNKETEEVNIKQTAYEDIHSSAAGKVNVEENFKQKETNATEVKEEDKKSETECIEQKFDATCPMEETKDETLKEEVKPNNVHDTQCTEVTLEETSATETKEDLVGNSSDSQVIEKETQDEILEKGEESVTGVADEKILKKVEQEDEMQLEIPDLASEEKGLVTTRLCEAVSNDTDIVNEGTNEAGKKQEHQLLNEKSEAGNSCTDTEKVVLEQDTSVEASRSSLIKYLEIEKAVVELETEDHIQKTEDFATEDTNTIEEGNLELHGQLRSVSELVAQDQQNETLPEISVKDHNMECSGERIKSQDLQKGELEINKEVEFTKNHTGSTHDHIEIMKDVLLGEEVHGAVELAEEGESFKEQHVREESCTTETQTQSALAETVNEIKEPDPVTTVNLQATNFRENEETASHVMEDLNRESEAFTITKTPEGNDESTEEVDINITSSGIEDPTDRFEEENKEEADNCNGKMEAVPVRMITEVTSLEEIHLDDKSVLALDSTQDNSSLEMKSSDTTLDSAESDSPNLGKSSGKISEHANPDETGIVKLPDADEVEVGKPETSDAATNSKEQKFGDILEIGESLDRTDTCKLEKEPNKVLEATAESKYQGVEAVIEGGVTSPQTLPTGDLRQPLIDPSSEIPPKEEDREHTPIEKCEDKSRRNDVMLVNEVSEGSFATDTEQETCLHKENSREIEVSRSESKFIENKEDDRSDTATTEEGIALLKSTSSKPEENVSMIECIEESFDTTCLSEETIAEVPKDETKPDQDCKTKGEALLRNPTKSQVSEKETKEEILENVELEVTDITEETSLKNFEQGIIQMNCTELAFEGKGLVITGLQETGPADVDVKAELAQASEMDENKGMRIPTAVTDEVYGAGEETEQEPENQTLNKLLKVEDERNITTVEALRSDVTGEGHKESSAQASSENKLVTTEASETANVTSENVEASNNFNKKNSKSTEPSERVHGAFELAEESENMKEQLVREESLTTELQTQSASAETINEIKESDPVTTVNLQATNFRENEEMASHLMEDLNRESEAFTITKTPEGNDEGTEKVDINITSSGIEDPTDRFEEENKEEADNCNGKIEAVPVRMITEVTSLQEIHLDDKSVLALDSTPDNSSLEMKSSDTTLDSAESDSPNLGESSGKISEHANPDEETGIVKIPDADEVEVEKPETSDAATNSKEQKFGDILEIGESLDRTDTCKLEKEPNKVLEATAESKYQGVEAVIEGEVTSHQTLPTGDLRQPLIDSSSEIPPKEEDRKPTPIEKCEDKSRRNDVMLVNEVSEGSFATDTEQETCLHKENSREIEVSRSESKFIENKEDDRSDTTTKEEGIALLKSTSSKPEENVSKIECIEESFDTTCLSEETIAEVPKDETKPDQDCKTKGETLLRNPTEFQVSEKETKEEILENVESEVTDITEETSLKNFEQGIIQLNCTELAFEGEGLVITGLQETGPADVDVKAELAQASEMDENKGMRIPTAVTDEVYGAGEETEQEPENQTLNKLPKVEDERNITIVEVLRSDVTGEGHKESFAQASSENKLVTTEASETANVTSENVEASNNFNKNSESTEPSEKVHGAFELAEESENMKEQLIREESFTTELQTQSASAETINEIKESNPITIVNLQATDFSEIEETIAQTTEDLIQESEAYIVTKPPEEGNDEGIEKHTGVTSSELVVSGELFKEENKEEPDNINAEMDAAPVGLIKEETSREEIHLDGSPVLAPEVENPKTSNAATNSKELNVEDIPENGENLDTSDIYKVEKDSNVLETIAESKFQVVESDKSRKNDDMLVNEIAEHSFATNTKQETFLQNESSRELEVSKSEREFVGNIDDDMYKATASEPEENVSKTECTEHNSSATCQREETIAQAPKDEAKCNQDCQTKVETVMGEQTSTGSQVLEEETKEEILQDVELTDTGISEETSLKKVEQEDVVQLNGTDLASEDEGLVITGFQGTGSDDFDMKAELAQASETDKNKDIQIPKPVTDEVYGAGEETEHEQENETPNELPKVEDERNSTTVESDVMEEDHKESSAQASRENKVITTEVSETVNVPSENVRASYKGTSSEYDEREEKLVQIEEKSVDASGDTDIVSTDREKSSAHEETHDEDKDPCTIPVLNSKKKITKSEQEDSLENSESNLTGDVEVEKAVELKAGDVSRETEGSEASTSILSEKNLESTGSCEQFRVTSVSVTENQSSKSLRQTSVKDQKSESTEEKITEQDFQENQMGRKQEVQLTSDDEKQINRGQDQTEIIKDVISTEEVPGGFQKAEESDNIKEEIIKKESFPTELHKASRLTETGCEVTDSEPLPTVNFEPAEFSQHSETVNSHAAEDRNRVSEASSNIETPEEEMKAFIEKPITVTSSAEQKDDAKESVIVENLDIKFEGEEIEISEQVVEDILGPERSLTMDGTGTYKPEEEINEVSEAICEPNYQGDEEVIEGDIVNTQTLPAGDLIYQLVEQSSAMELEPNKRNDSPDEPKKEERITLEEATSVEPKGNFSELRLDESLLDCTRDIELKEDMSKSEEMEMKEDLPKAITTQEAEENQSEKANDSNEITKSKISSEQKQTLEEREVVMDSPMVSPSEETFGKSSQEDDVQMIENYAETTDQKGETMKNTILNEQLSEELERATAAGDRADEDQHHSSVGNISLAHEEKNVEEVHIKVDLQEKNDGKDSGKTDIEETILSKEEDNSSKVELVKIGEDISFSGDKEIVIRTHEGQNSDFELPPVTDVVAEEAPREEVEEVSEPAPKEHSHETFETYNVKDETENTNGSESLVDDTKSKNTPLESALDRNGVPEEQEPSANKLHISTPTESLNEEVADKEIRNTGDEKHNDLMSEEQERDEVSIPEKGIHIKDNGAHVEHEEPIDVLTKGGRMKLDDVESDSPMTANEDGETKEQNEKLNASPHTKDSENEVSKEDGTVDVKNCSEISQDKEKGHLAISDKQILIEPVANESTMAKISTGNKDVPIVQQLTSGNFLGAEPKGKKVACQEEKNTSTDLAKFSSQDNLQGSSEEASQVAEDLTRDRSLPENIEDPQADNKETAEVEEQKKDEDKDEEEEGDENKRVDSGYDAPVMVEASRDMDMKVSPPKKSHGILSGVGSKVKHSISKVKKVITGKSSHPKPPSPK